MEKSEKIEKQEMMENDELLMKRDDMKRLKLTAKEILSTSPKKMSLTGKKSHNCETEDRIVLVKTALLTSNCPNVHLSKGYKYRPHEPLGQLTKITFHRKPSSWEKSFLRYRKYILQMWCTLKILS